MCQWVVCRWRLRGPSKFCILAERCITNCVLDWRWTDSAKKSYKMMAPCVERNLPVRGMQAETTRTLRGHRGAAHDNTCTRFARCQFAHWGMSALWLWVAKRRPGSRVFFFLSDFAHVACFVKDVARLKVSRGSSWDGGEPKVKGRASKVRSLKTNHSLELQ